MEEIGEVLDRFGQGKFSRLITIVTNSQTTYVSKKQKTKNITLLVHLHTQLLREFSTKYFSLKSVQHVLEALQSNIAKVL